MRLKAAARYFDNLTCVDAYSAGSPFKAQFDLFDDARRDSLTAVRRIVSVAPEIVPPARRVFAVTDADGTHQWLVGEAQTDFFKQEAIRHKWICQKAKGLASLYTFAGVLSGTPITTAYCGLGWVKGAKELEVSSGLFNVWDLYLARTEPDSDLILLDGTYYLKRTTYDTEAGFFAVQADELTNPLVSVTLKNRTYLPVSDTWSEAPITLPGVFIRWQSHYRYFAQYAHKYEAGDAQLLMAHATAPALKAGDVLTVGGKAYTVIAPVLEGSVWSTHVRPA